VTSAKIDKLVRMANQIGDFFQVMPEEEATQGVATHLERFWTPKMIRELVTLDRAGLSGLNPTAASGVAALKRKTELEPENGAG
jgi:formate dehydrogenase subunit delta